MLQITVDGTDVSDHIIAYTREKDLCSSEGIVEFELDYHLSVSTYDLILAYENTVLKGTFYLDTIEKFPDGRTTLHGRDNSKRAQDYFIPDQYVVEGDTTSRHWIETFLTMAGISYNFTTTDTGYIIQEGEILGLTSVQETVEQLVRYSGWYIYYNSSNVAQIGKLAYSASSYEMALDDTDIISINYNKSDMYLRNRAVVWGAGYTGAQEWTFADISVNTPWNYDSTDKRAILARAGFPIPYSQALGTAQVLLNEYARLVMEKTITLHGFYDLEIGEFVLINSSYYNGICLVSQVNVTVEDGGGYRTTIVLDRRCPRFVGFYDIGMNNRVYAGTAGSGVWYKQLDETTWTNFSTGLTDLYIKDLDVSYGVFSAVTDGGHLYGRTIGDASWTRLQPSYFYDSVNLLSHTASEGKFVASTISDIDQAIYGVFTLDDESKTWITKYKSVTSGYTNVFVTISGSTSYRGLDIEAQFEDLYISVVNQTSNVVPFGYNSKGQDIGFTSSALLTESTTFSDPNTYSELKYFGLTGNYVYSFNEGLGRVRRENFRTGAVAYVAHADFAYHYDIYYVPKSKDVGYMFLEGRLATVIHAYKVDWVSGEASLVTSTNLVGMASVEGIIGTVNDSGSIRAAFSFDNGSGYYIDVPVFDCDTEEFRYYMVCENATNEYYQTGQYHMGVPFPKNVVDAGDGVLVFVSYASDNAITYLNTREGGGVVDIFIPYLTYELYNHDKLGVNFSTKEVYCFVEVAPDDHLGIIKTTLAGTYSLLKEFDYWWYDETYNYEMAYDLTKAIAIWANGIETLYYDCINNIERSREYMRADSVFSKSIGPDGFLYEVHAEYDVNPQVNLYFTSDDNYYGEWKVEGENYGTNGTALNYNSTSGWNFTLSPVIDDFVEISLVRSRVVQGTSSTVEYLNRDNYLEDYTMYMITSVGNFISNTSGPVHSTGFTTYGISNLGTQPGVGKHGGPTLEDCYATALDLGDFSNTTYHRRASPDGNHGEVFIWYDPLVTQTHGNNLGIHHGDRLDWSGDNDGEITVNVYKYDIENRVTEVYFESYIKHPVYMTSAWVRINYKRIGTSTFKDYRVTPFIQVNGERYYENTLYSTTTTRYRTFDIDLGGEVLVTEFIVGFEVLAYNSSVAVSYLTMYADVENYTPFSIEKVHPYTASRVPFRSISQPLPGGYSWYNISYLRGVDQFLEFDTETYSYEVFPSTSNRIRYAFDNLSTASTGNILRYRDSTFESVYGVSGAQFYLDASSPGLITAYAGVVTSGLIYLDGEPYSTGSSRGDLFFSFAGDTFRHINLPTMSGSYIFDSRGFTLIDEYGDYRNCIGLVVLSGMFGSVGQFSYIDVTEYEDFGSVIVFPDIHTVENFNYVPVALETSNYNHISTPFFFVGLSGTSTPFLQRNIDEATFTNMSDNFPSSKITTIRLDDML